MPSTLDVPGASVDDVLRQVKEAISLARRLDEQAGAGTEVKLVDLTLKVFTEVSAGAKVEFKIPIIDQKVVLGGGLDRQQTQTIQVTFEPATARPGPEARDVKNTLVYALVGIRQSMQAAAGGDVPLNLKSGVVTLDFILEGNGSISLIVEAGAKAKWANTIKLTVGPRDL